MAKNEIVNVLTIKTEDSQKTIKGLKKEISDLKKILDNAVIGTDEFEKASKNLANAQNTLKAALSGQKQTTEALAGSYDALVAEMAELKKEWRATADEAKRNDLGKQIDNINTQLKDLDATIGNNQRKVGAYAEEFGKALEKNNDSVAASASAFKQALGKQDDATIKTRTQLESVQKVATGLASGYAAVQGVMTLLNIENENLQKAMVKVQSAMAIAQGVGGLKDLVEGVSRAKVAFGGAVNGVKLFIKGLSGVQKAIIGTGIGALVVAVGLLIANWDKITKYFKDITAIGRTTKATRELNAELGKLAAQTAAEKIVRIKELAREYGKLGDNLNAKKTFVTQYKDELADMGIEMNNVNDAEKIFREKTQNYINAIMARAKADAARKKATEDYQKALDGITEAEKKVEEKEQGVVIAEKNEREFTAGYESAAPAWAPEAQVAAGGAVSASRNQVADAKQELANAKKEYEDLQTEADAALEKLFKFAETQDALADEWLKGTDGSGKGSGSGSKQKTPFEEALERVKSALKEQADELLTEEEKLDNEYRELLKKLEGNQEAQFLATEWYINEKTKLVEKELDAQIELNNKIAENNRKAAEERIRQDEENYQKEVAASEKRLNSRLGNIDKETEKDVYTTERRKPKGNGEINAIDNELSKLETLKSITKETMNLKIAAIDAEMALFEQSSERWKELQYQRISIVEESERTIAELREQYREQEKARDRALAGSIANTFTSTLQGASSIISALQEGIDQDTKEGFEKNKKMQIANATIQMLVGVTSALAGAFTTKSGPWDWILATIQAVSIAAAGGIQIDNIKKQTFEGAGSSTSVSPTTLGMSDNLPVAYTRNLMTNSETEEMNKAQKVYILESDIEESGKRVEIRENNTDF